MARQGLLLDEDGICFGLVRFQRAEPKDVHYRLVSTRAPAKLRELLLGDVDYYLPPPEEEQEFFAQYGWSYVSKCGRLYIYQSEGQNRYELDSDPQVQAIGITAVRNMEGAYLLSFLIVLALNYFLHVRGSFFLIAIDGLMWYLLAIFLLPAWIALLSAAKLVYFDKLRRRLKIGEKLKHQINWRSGVLLYRLVAAFHVGIVSLFAVAVVCSLSGVIQPPPSARYVLQEYPGDPPFATVKELAPPGDYTLNSDHYSSGASTQSVRGVPVTIYWNEKADVVMADGQVFTAALSVSYHVTEAPWLARAIASDYLEEGRGFVRRQGQPYETFPLAELGMDYARAYRNVWGEPTVIFQKENRVLMASFQQFGDAQLSFEEWTKQMANAFDTSDIFLDICYTI